MEQKHVLCIDRVVAYHHKPKAAELAIKENPHNRPKPLPMLSGVSAHPAKLALVTGKKWKNGRVLGVAFLDGDSSQKHKVMKNAQEWCRFANIKFDFNAGAQAEIRISFQVDPGSWSAVGTDCLVTEAFPPGAPTMNFGWLRGVSPCGGARVWPRSRRDPRTPES
jgi:hypothetical protein